MKNQGYEDVIAAGRRLMKSNFTTSQMVTDQQKKLDQPPVAKGCKTENGILLPPFSEGDLATNHYYTLLSQRRSRRVFAQEEISLRALHFLLWSTQGVLQVAGGSRPYTLRPVASGGARHAFETYLVINRVQGLAPGLYHYLPLQNKLEFLGEPENRQDQLAASLSGQTWAGQSAAVLFWAANAYRCEWRYGDKAHKLMLLDAGHVGQNLMLSAEALGLGSCCMAAYDQKACDTLLGLDGEQEFVVYAAAVGTPKPQPEK
ncbi:MAG: SagB/ThcOx family dehydrogenase [Oscillospiraceae bacterium]